ncbi:MAG: phospholipase [Phycisphaerae bacterium]|nr:phospholipase [Phycisphaerae bacterium]
MIEFLTDRQIYEKVVLDRVPRAKKFLWIATADIKDLHVRKGRTMVPFLEVLSDLAGKKVELRLLHAKEPGPRFRQDFDRYPALLAGLERILCPRVHFKAVVIDGTTACIASANLTGAGMGAKGDTTRNFESAILTDEPKLVSAIMEQFDAVWRGQHCKACRRKRYCGDYRDMLGR